MPSVRTPMRNQAVEPKFPLPAPRAPCYTQLALPTESGESNMDFHAATVDFLADRKRRECMASSLFAYAKLLRWFIAFLESRQIQDTACISVEDIAAYIDTMQAGPAPLSAVTVHRRMTTLRVFL